MKTVKSSCRHFDATTAGMVGGEGSFQVVGGTFKLPELFQSRHEQIDRTSDQGRHTGLLSPTHGYLWKKTSSKSRLLIYSI